MTILMIKIVRQVILSWKDEIMTEDCLFDPIHEKTRSLSKSIRRSKSQL